ncbi:MAG: hypothetical protein PF690_03590 [Deltaproteobacteria bacterium]|jgi:hypothetical protein|nr:hypothetical protein [Deltaproteobacteria bacterium]
MSEVLNKIQGFMEKHGIPGRDGYELAASGKAFPDGANFRTEIAGVERASTMEAMIKEADKRQIVIHRAIAAVGGSTYCDARELKDMAQMANDAKIEIVMTVGHRKGWDVGAKEMATAEGMMQGFRLRGSDNIAFHIADIMRSIDAGFRGFLVYDEGVMFILNKMREEGLIPAETIFKFSVFGGYCNAAGAKVIESMGANSLNPISDISRPILSSIRKAINIPLDVYTIVPNSFGGNFRAYEAPEIAKIASPCYLKYEPGTSEDDIYMPWVTEEWHENFIKQKVKIASIVLEIMDKHAPEMKTSLKGAKDLVLTKTS